MSPMIVANLGHVWSPIADQSSEAQRCLSCVTKSELPRSWSYWCNRRFITWTGIWCRVVPAKPYGAAWMTWSFIVSSVHRTDHKIVQSLQAHLRRACSLQTEVSKGRAADLELTAGVTIVHSLPATLLIAALMKHVRDFLVGKVDERGSISLLAQLGCNFAHQRFHQMSWVHHKCLLVCNDPTSDLYLGHFWIYFERCRQHL